MRLSLDRSLNSARAGFSLLEILVVLAIMALTATLVIPRGNVMLDRITLHAVFFDTQRQISDLRRQAYRRQETITVGSETAPSGEVAEIEMKEGFHLAFSEPLVISDGGVCPLVVVEVLRGDSRVMTLQTTDRACHFVRLN